MLKASYTRKGGAPPTPLPLPCLTPAGASRFPEREREEALLRERGREREKEVVGLVAAPATLDGREKALRSQRERERAEREKPLVGLLQERENARVARERGAASEGERRRC